MTSQVLPEGLALHCIIAAAAAAAAAALWLVTLLFQNRVSRDSKPHIRLFFPNIFSPFLSLPPFLLPSIN